MMISILHIIRTFIIDNTNQSHEVHTLGEFKDDQLQNLTGSFLDVQSGRDHQTSGVFDGNLGASTAGYDNDAGRYTVTLYFDASRVARTGTTTHGKQIGINYLIKAL